MRRATGAIFKLADSRNVRLFNVARRQPDFVGCLSRDAYANVRPDAEAMGFDFAGTLAQSRTKDLIQLVADCVTNRFAVPVPFEVAVRAMGGDKRLHLRDVLKTVCPGLSEDEYDDRADICMQEFNKRFPEVAAKAEVIPGILKMLEDTAKLNIKLFGTSSYPRNILEQVLEATGIGRYVPFVAPGNGIMARPAPDMILKALDDHKIDHRRTVFIFGDTAPDVKSVDAARSVLGQSNGLKSVVTYDTSAFATGDAAQAERAVMKVMNAEGVAPDYYVSSACFALDVARFATVYGGLLGSGARVHFNNGGVEVFGTVDPVLRRELAGSIVKKAAC